MGDGARTAIYEFSSNHKTSIICEGDSPRFQHQFGSYANELPPIAQALKTCADELSPIAQAGKTCADELPPTYSSNGGKHV